MYGARLTLLLVAFWWGSLTTTGFVAVPVLFAKLKSPALAGNVAGHLFEAQSWIAIGCALCLLGHSRARAVDTTGAKACDGVVWIIAALLLALLLQYGVAPRILARENLRLWHALGSVMYVCQWACASVLLWRMSRRDG